MQRRTFLATCIPAAFPFAHDGWGQTDARHSRLDSSAAGQRVNLAAYGDAKSWAGSESSIASRAWLDSDPRTALKIADLPSNDSETDLGVEWPEFRTIEQVVVRYAAEDKAPNRGRQILEFWSGLTTRQGSWKVMEDGAAVGNYLQVDRRTWIYTFPPRRTCKIRLRFQDRKNIEIEQFSIFGPSKWKVGELAVEWGHLGTSKSYDGSIETYNAELLGLTPRAGITLHGGASWISQAGNGKIAGLTL
ncbi:MAG: hypothetical protein M3Y27_26910, partial [Acidobacteriota bacterium]|nr:hypothetical protein [Acidobacteriota bacterium]